MNTFINTQYIISAAIISFGIPIFGLLINYISIIMQNIFCKILGNKMALILMNWLTFPGVIHHELSHMIFAIITGAKICSVNLFKPKNNTLGSVKFITNGNIIKKNIQSVATSVAPIICGMFTLTILTLIIKNIILPIWIFYLIVYLMFSIFVHMSMSWQDTKIMLKNIWFIYLIIYLICWDQNINVLKIMQSII